MKGADDGPALSTVFDLSALRKTERAPVALDKRVKVPRAGRAPIGFSLVTPEGSPLWVLLVLDPSDPSDTGLVVATGPIATQAIMARLMVDAESGAKAATK